MSYKQTTLKRLFARSGNQCGFPDCDEALVDEEGTIVAEISHIKAQSPGGPRYDPSLGEEEIDEYSNLILLCPTHHSLIDKNPGEYPVEEIEEWKEEQEAKAAAGVDLSDEQLTKLQLNDPKLESELQVTISNAKDRYTPELHVDTSASTIFEALGRTPAFVESVEDRLEDLDDVASDLFSGKSIEVLKDADEDAYLSLRDSVEQIPELLEEIDQVTAEVPIQDLRDTLEEAENAILELEPELHDIEEETDDSGPSPVSSTLRHFRRLRSEIYELKSFSEGDYLKSADKYALKVLGEAGIGKTHLLCNVAQNRMENGYPTILLLGEQFSNRDIWTQIIERFGLNCTTDEFLDALNSLGKSRGVRSLIMIDALNESANLRIWDRNLPGMLRKLEDYPYIGICVSCRTGYEEIVFPDSIDDQCVEKPHQGFSKVEYEAVRRFFDAHGIEHSSMPVFKREFRIPLFLKLFCENLESKGQSRVSHGPEGLTEIFEGYIDGVHDRLHQRLDYDPNENKVRNAAEALAREMAKKGEGTKRLPRNEAKDIINEFLPRRSFSESLYRNMLSEGVISEVVPFNEEASESVRFSYDKFADHMLAQQYLELYVEGDFGEVIDESEELQEIFENPMVYSGLIQAFAIHLPEQEGVEIFEFVDSDEILIPFIKSLGWRDPDTLVDENGDLKDQIDNHLQDEIDQFEELHELWRVLLTLATSSEHPMNAEHLHEILMRQEIANRDFIWSEFLHSEFREETSEVYRLIHWGFSPEHNPIESLEVKRLMSITLSWFLSCPNRYVRDRSTKAIVSVVGSDLDLYLELIELFQEVDDPYILERVYAAAYGGVLRHYDHESVEEIANQLYKLEFEDNDPTPNFLTRDYARGVIELADHCIEDYEADLGRVRPPYDSSFAIDIPTPAEVQEQISGILEESDSELQSRFWTGLLGEGYEKPGFSDFSRYIVGTNHDSSHVHGYDLSGAEALRWITWRVFDLGWNPDWFGNFDHYVNRWSQSSRGTRKPERFSKKYQWIAYYELMAWITDNRDFVNSTVEKSYSGPWTSWDRNIDPSVLEPEVGEGRSLDEAVEYDCRVDEVSVEEWISDHEEFPDLNSLLDISVEDENWIPLHGIYKWRADEEEFSRLDRDVFCRIDPVIVSEDDEEELVEWIRDNWVMRDDLGSTLVSLPALTQICRGEYPWHPIVEDRWEDESSVIRGASIDTDYTTIDLLWEAEYDCSVDEKYGIYVPSPTLAKLLDLRWAVDTKEYVQQTGPVRVADVSETENLFDRVHSLSMLAANSTILNELAEEGLTIVWVIQGEKRLTGGLEGNEKGLSQIRGVYRLNSEGKYVGEIETDFHSWK